MHVDEMQQRVAFLESIGVVPGMFHTISRTTVYGDVLELYQTSQILNEYPIHISYESEMADDQGGVTRDMLSAFWEEAYRLHFDGATILVPLIHPQTDITQFRTLGKIISHGYLVSGYLPVCINLPSLLGIFLPGFEIPSPLLLDTLVDYVSPNERDQLKCALECKDSSSFFRIQSDILAILSRFGCRQFPTIANLPKLMVDIAKYEFCIKPAAAISMIHHGIPEQQMPFWQQLGIEGITKTYYSLTVAPDKVLKVLDGCCTNPAEERTYAYLTTMVSSMSNEELRNFLRFITGSSVCITDKISITFNSTSGFTRHPIAHTCGCVLELPVSYMNYHDFYSEWAAILKDVDNNWKWYMDSI